MNSEVTQKPAEQMSYGHEISLVDLVNLLFRRRRIIIASTFISTLIALFLALTAKFDYTATASFLSTNQGDRGGLSGASSLAQQFGFSFPSAGSSDRSPQFYQNLLESRNILDQIVLLGVDVPTADGTRTVDLSEHFQIETQVPEIRHAITRDALVGAISTSFALATSVVTVNIRTSDPEISASIGRRLLELITDFDLKTRQSQASAEGDFSEGRLRQLQAELLTAEDSLKVFLDENRQFDNSPYLQFEHDRLLRRVIMKQDLVSAMAQAYEQARIDQVRNSPTITVIDQPDPPETPNARGRLMTLIMGVTLGLLLGFILAVAREFSERVKKKDDYSYRELREILDDARRDPLGLRNASAIRRDSILEE